MKDGRRWERLEWLFDRALELGGDERSAFLLHACPDDVGLRREVEGLLAEHDRDPDFLDTPIARVDEVLEGPDLTEQTLGPYRFVRLLGRGGMGRVYLAMDQREDLQRPVAVKMIRRELDTDEVLGRFRLERRILARLRHPHIAQLLDGGATEDGRPYVVMEYVDGEPIDVYCAERNLPVDARLRLFLTVCEAVHHAHGNLVVHRDLKPGNILVTAEGDPKLMDFGIAGLVDPDAGDQAVGVRPLTPGYASPEQLRGEAVGVASDVYQLGLLLFEVLAGTRPRGKAESEEVAATGALPRPPSSMAPPSQRRALVGDLDAIVLHALHPDPRARYPSVVAMAEDVKRHLQGLPVGVRASSARYRLGKFLGRHRWAAGAAGVVLVSLAWAGAYSVAQSRRVVRERDRAVEIQGFLLEMFGATGPDQATGDSVTARQLLDRQAQALATTYPDRPVLRAQMMTVLAEGYDRLGLPADAEPLARQALEIRQASLEPRDPGVAQSMSFLGWVLYQAGKADEGEDLLRAAIARFREARPGDPKTMARALNDLGVIREAAGDYDEAEGLYREAITLRTAEGGESAQRALAVTASNLSVILYRKGDFAGAAATAERALSAIRTTLGPDHQRAIIIQSNLAAFQLAEGNVEAAEAQYRDLVERETRLQGRNHPVTARVMASLGSTLLSQERWAAADSVFREVVAIQEARLGPEHPEVAAARFRLGQAMSREGKAEEALPLVTAALEADRTRLGPDHPRVARETEALADVMGYLGRFAEAERLHREAVGILADKLGPDHPETSSMRLRYGHRLILLGQLELANAELAHAERALAATFGPEHRALIAVRLRLAQADLTVGRVGEADSLLALADVGLGDGAHLPNLRALRDSLRAGELPPVLSERLR